MYNSIKQINLENIMSNKIKYKKLTPSKCKNFCDELWAIVVKIKDNNKCVICGATEYINAHHLLSRRVLLTQHCINTNIPSTRHSPINGISVCPNCHEYSLTCSFHTAPWSAQIWVQNNRPEQFEDWCKNRESILNGIEINYEEVYLFLENEHKKLTGNYFRIERISQFLLYKFAYDIKEKIKSNTDMENILKTLPCELSKKKLQDFINTNKKFFNN